VRKGLGVIKQILLTLAVTAIVVLIIQARRRRHQVAQNQTPAPGRSPQAIAGWVLLALMVSVAIGAAFLHQGY
jgi:hypothetical protein